jgi:transcriptional regulator with XRE-family HTH domain
MAHQASTDPQRTPAGDRNRRMALGLSLAAFAEKAGITPTQLHDYETTAAGDHTDPNVALVVGLALDLEEGGTRTR